MPLTVGLTFAFPLVNYKEVDMKFKVNKANLAFYSVVMFMIMTVVVLFQAKQMNSINFQAGIEKRVIKCEIPLPNKLVQNLYFVATDLESARQMLFNSKQGLFFDNTLYVKTADFKGQKHVVPFDLIKCDSVGTQVSLTSL